MELCVHLHSSPARMGVSVKTIQIWHRLGIVPAKRTTTNRLYYSDSDLAAALGLARPRKDRRTVVYCRVSGRAKSRIERIKKEYLCSSVTSNRVKSMKGSRKLAAG